MPLKVRCFSYVFILDFLKGFVLKVYVIERAFVFDFHGHDGVSLDVLLFDGCDDLASADEFPLSFRVRERADVFGVEFVFVWCFVHVFNLSELW